MCFNTEMNQKPLLIWDGDCGFCRRWVTRFQRITGDRVEYMPYQTALSHFSNLNEAECKQAVHFIDVQGKIFKAAHAVFCCLAEVPRFRWLLKLYQHNYFFRILSERAYAWVARNRSKLKI